MAICRLRTYNQSQKVIKHQLKQLLTAAIHERNWNKADTYKNKIDETRIEIEKILKTINGEI